MSHQPQNSAGSHPTQPSSDADAARADVAQRVDEIRTVLEVLRAVGYPLLAALLLYRASGWTRWLAWPVAVVLLYCALFAWAALRRRLRSRGRGR